MCRFVIGLRLRGLTEDEITFRGSTFAWLTLYGVDIDAVVDGHIRLKAVISAPDIVRLLLSITFR